MLRLWKELSNFGWRPLSGRGGSGDLFLVAGVWRPLSGSREIKKNIYDLLGVAERIQPFVHEELIIYDSSSKFSNSSHS